MSESRECVIDGCSKPAFCREYCNSHYKRLRRYGDPLAGGTPLGAPLKWLTDVAVGYDSDGCLEWPFAKADGYGSLRYQGKTVGAHRLVCALAHGEPTSPELEAAHGCGNPGCVNPEHLRWATPKQNIGDRREHGTLKEGENSPLSKLTTDQVLAMRTMHRDGKSYAEIARSFDHSLSATRRIVLGETWKNTLSEGASA